MRRRKETQRGGQSNEWFYWILVVLAVGVLGVMFFPNFKLNDSPFKGLFQTEPAAKPAATNPPPPVAPRSNSEPPLKLIVRQPTNVPPAKSLTNAWVGPRPVTNGPAPTNVPPVPIPAGTNLPPSGLAKRPAQDLLEAQVALSRLGISPGSIDGSMGNQTRAALRLFQKNNRLPVTGLLDEATQARLLLDAPPMAAYTITLEDLARLRPIPATWLGKSLADRLDFENLLELVSEKAHTHPLHIRRLNPQFDWRNAAAGQKLNVPAADYPPVKTKAAQVRIHLAGRTLQAFDAAGGLLAHFPCSIAREVVKRPVGELYVVSIVLRPNYVFNPEIFPESAEGRELGRKLVLPPGPNNPVGIAWIGLNRPGYGIHGTPKPEEVGRTESHGCFRLANWNAEYLSQLVAPGTPVFVEP